MISPMACRPTSLRKLTVQPPWANPLLGSSSGPPGACMTPSSETWVMAMIFLIRTLRFCVLHPEDEWPARVPTRAANILSAQVARRSELFSDRHHDQRVRAYFPLSPKDSLQPGCPVECAHQRIHRDHSVQQ